MKMGTGTLLVSLAGFVWAYWNRKCLLATYLLVMAALIVILLALLILVFVVTRPDGGYGVEGRAYREYRLDGYSKWLRDNVVGNGNWGTIRRCLVEKDVCGRLGADYPTHAFFAAHLTPLQMGNVETRLFSMKIESLQAENQTLLYVETRLFSTQDSSLCRNPVRGILNAKN